MKIYTTNSEAQTRRLAEKLAKKFTSGIIALIGELGAGKTTFVQGFAKGLGIKEKIISPTFILIRQYKVPNSKKILYHIDLYRLDNEKQVKTLGLKDLLNDKYPAFGRTNHLILIEWAGKAKNLLPKNTICVIFETIKDNKRKITFTLF